MVLPWTFIGHANKRKIKQSPIGTQGDLSAIMKIIFEPEDVAQDSILTV